MWRRRRPKAPKIRRGIGGFLDEGSEIEGKYACSGTVMLNGRLRGEIYSEDTLIIGPVASVHASVQTGSLIAYGEIVGNVTAAKRVELKSGARVTGNIDAPVIVMEEGVLLEGQCHMVQESEIESSSPSNELVLAQ